ncbi:hypothetical protein H6G76_20245 [Nostoc sp. FACHB-152]|nr:hypothetical protein [Nostoc sp. FACHB-152]MBD2470785.1 hypothetical protein [Nostoc sp. FACHB-145]
MTTVNGWCYFPETLFVGCGLPPVRMILRQLMISLSLPDINHDLQALFLKGSVWRNILVC